MFSRSQRFKDKGSGVPAPGTYDVGVSEQLSGQASFDKSIRFRMGDSVDASFIDESETPRKSAVTTRQVRSKSVQKKLLPLVNEKEDSLLIIAEFEKEVERLSCACRELNKQLLASRQEVSRLEDTLQEEANDKSKLEKKFARLQENSISFKKGKELEALVAQLQGGISGLKEANYQLKQDLDKAKQTCKSRELEASECRNQIASITQDKQLLETLLSQQQDERTQMLADFAKHEQLAIEVSTDNKESQEKLKLFETKMQALTLEKQELHDNVEVLKKKLEAAAKETDVQQSEHQETLEALTRKCLTFEEEAAHQKQLRKENEAVLKSQLLVIEVSNKQLEREKQATIGVLNDKESELVELKKQLEGLSFEHEQDRGVLESKLQQVMDIAEEWKEKEADQRRHLEEIRIKNKQVQTELTEKNGELTSVREKLASVEKELVSAKSRISDGERIMLTKEMNSRLEETRKNLSLQEERNKTLESDLMARIAELEAEVKRLCAENESLKQALADIEEEYRPYQEKIDNLEDQNRLLRSQAIMAQQEAQRLSEQYAKLLGHQNQKQKIQHVKKLKDENASLKQEITQLKSDISRHKRTIQRMEEERGIPVTQSKCRPLSSRN